MKTASRLKIFRAILGLGFLAGILGSLELWFPVERNFPRAPLLVEMPENSVVFLERFLTVVLLASLVSTIFRRQKIFFIIALISVVFLIFLDQTRLQPWVYQYLLLLFVLISGKEGDKAEDQTLALAQIMLAALYFWSGVQKMNYTFSHETLPMLAAPLQNLFPLIQLPSVFLGLLIALIEAFVGLGLLFRKTRNLAVCLAILTHLTILGLLIVKNYNHIVWLWNASLMALISTAFWRSDVFPKQAFREKGSPKTAGTIVAAAAVFLPVLNFFGLWDMYLSGALYSGNSPVGVIRIDEDLQKKLPSKAQAVIFQTKTGGERMLPLVEWALAEMNVPVYPERRVFRQIGAKVCERADDKDQIELIVKQRPDILDGKFKVARISCAELENH